MADLSLRRYQWNGVLQILDLKRLALLWLPGAGKTATVVTALEILIASDEVERILVVAPKRVAWSVWPAEVKLWSNLDVSLCCGDTKLKTGAYTLPKLRKALDASAEVYVTDYDTLLRVMKHHGKKWPYDMVVLDEASRVKHHSSNRSRLIARVADHSKRWVNLTGTPASNGFVDLFNQIRILDGGKRLLPKITHFRNKWCKQIGEKQHNRWVIRGTTSKQERWSMEPDEIEMNDKLRCSLEDDIIACIRDIAFSIDITGKIDLPPLTYNTVVVDMPPEARAGYQEFQREYELNFSEDEVASSPAAAAAAGKLMQLANGAVYLDDTERKWKETHTAKLDALADIIEESAGSPVLVLYNFISDKERILSRFKQAKHIDDVDLDEWNRREVPMMLMYPGGAAGLNIQYGSNIAVWFGPPASIDLDQWEQTNTRLPRSGQQHHVFIHTIVARGTRDEYAMTRLKEKAVDQDKVMAGLLTQPNQ